jgi:hypothetical protein
MGVLVLEVRYEGRHEILGHGLGDTHPQMTPLEVLQLLNSLRCFIDKGKYLLSVFVKDPACLCGSYLLAEFIEKGKNLITL